MKNIVTITFNPAIDKSTSVKRLVAAHKMHTTEPLYQPGGGGVNVSRALKKLGFSAAALYFEGGKTGAFYSDLLVAEEVEMIPVKIAGSTRENFIVNEEDTGKQFRFGLPGPRVSALEIGMLINRLTSIDYIDFLVVSGSLAPGISTDIFKTLKVIANSKHAKLVVDTSGKALKSALSSGVYLIKPSIGELANLTGKTHLTVSQAIDAAKAIVNSGKCKIIVISRGGQGAVLVRPDAVIKVKAPFVKVVSTVGAGDSMLAGMILSLAKNEDIQTALRYGVACGTAATLTLGTGLCDKKSADQLFELIQ